jgi:hypothetical protein
MPGYRGTFVGELTKQQYDIIDAAEKVAAELGTDAVTGSLERAFAFLTSGSHLWFSVLQEFSCTKAVLGGLYRCKCSKVVF